MPWSSARQDPAYGRAEWKAARLAALRRAQWRCEIRLEGCAGSASEVDHVDGIAQDPGHKNLRAACKPCHRKVSSKQGHSARWGSGTGDPEHRPRTAW